MYNEEFYNLDSSPISYDVIKSVRTEWAEWKKQEIHKMFWMERLKERYNFM